MDEINEERLIKALYNIAEVLADTDGTAGITEQLTNINGTLSAIAIALEEHLTIVRKLLPRPPYPTQAEESQHIAETLGKDYYANPHLRETPDTVTPEMGWTDVSHWIDGQPSYIERQANKPLDTPDGPPDWDSEEGKP